MSDYAQETLICSQVGIEPEHAGSDFDTDLVEVNPQDFVESNQLVLRYQKTTEQHMEDMFGLGVASPQLQSTSWCYSHTSEVWPIAWDNNVRIASERKRQPQGGHAQDENLTEIFKKQRETRL
jgi:hypothetical protein